MPRPSISCRIALSMRVVNVNGLNERQDAISRNWFLFLRQCGITPVMIPNLVEFVPQYLKENRLEGLILTGGNNISPDLYQYSGDGEVDDLAPDRDRTEKAMLDYMFERRLPVFGVCRGLQMVNVYCGGAIIKNSSHRRNNIYDHIGTIHPVRLLSPEFVEIAGTDTIKVNSFHQYGFTTSELGRGLIPIAGAPDGLVEGVIHKDLPVIAIMWHPERENPAQQFDKALFKSLFVDKKIFTRSAIEGRI